MIICNASKESGLFSLTVRILNVLHFHSVYYTPQFLNEVFVLAYYKSDARDKFQNPEKV
jgi:hypothetical protein